MLETIFISLLSSALILKTPSIPPKPPVPHIAFTQVLPDKNYVSYVVENKDTLTTISQKYYGTEEQWTTLWNDNSWIIDPDNLDAGKLLNIRAKKPDAPEALHEELAKQAAQLTEKKNEQYLQGIGYLAKINGSSSNVTKALPESQPASQTVLTDTASVQSHASVTPAAPSSYDAVYQAAGAKYGVPWQILYGIHMTETGGRDGAISNGSGSGAQGPMQFMPGTWRAYAVNGKGNGEPDINNATDAIYTAANYLAKHGSLDAGLRSYGGNTAGTLNFARAKGYAN